jgi:formylmethanofuran dehydrogenase subunit D
MKADIKQIELSLGESLVVKTPHGRIVLHAFREDKEFEEIEHTKIVMGPLPSCKVKYTASVNIVDIFDKDSKIEP